MYLGKSCCLGAVDTSNPFSVLSNDTLRAIQPFLQRSSGDGISTIDPALQMVITTANVPGSYIVGGMYGNNQLDPVYSPNLIYGSNGEGTTQFGLPANSDNYDVLANGQPIPTGWYRDEFAPAAGGPVYWHPGQSLQDEYKSYFSGLGNRVQLWNVNIGPSASVHDVRYPDPSKISFDPVYGLVTTRDNIVMPVGEGNQFLSFATFIITFAAMSAALYAAVAAAAGAATSAGITYEAPAAINVSTEAGTALVSTPIAPVSTAPQPTATYEPPPAPPSAPATEPPLQFADAGTTATDATSVPGFEYTNAAGESLITEGQYAGLYPSQVEAQTLANEALREIELARLGGVAVTQSEAAGWLSAIETASQAGFDVSIPSDIFGIATGDLSPGPLSAISPDVPSSLVSQAGLPSSSQLPSVPGSSAYQASPAPSAPVTSAGTIPSAGSVIGTGTGGSLLTQVPSWLKTVGSFFTGGQNTIPGTSVPTVQPGQATAGALLDAQGNPVNTGDILTGINWAWLLVVGAGLYAVTRKKRTLGHNTRG